jgi:hypothetical protein
MPMIAANCSFLGVAFLVSQLYTDCSLTPSNRDNCLADSPRRVRSERRPLATNLIGQLGIVVGAFATALAVRFASTVDFLSSATTWRLSAAISRR